MADSDERDDQRLAGRRPRPAHARPEDAHAHDGEDDDEPADEQLDAVTRLMGFLRSGD